MADEDFKILDAHTKAALEEKEVLCVIVDDPVGDGTKWLTAEEKLDIALQKHELPL